MKVLTFSRQFPKDHPKAGIETHFAEKIWNSFRNSSYSLPPHIAKFTGQYPYKGDEYLQACERIKTIGSKFHTIRTGSRFSPGEKASLRVWSGTPYRSKQIEFAQVEVKKVWSFNIHVVDDDLVWQVPGFGSGSFDTKSGGLQIIASHDGLEIRDFIDWFNIHPKAKGQAFTGQIICWNESINY